jgi:hypothetical protein
VNGAQRTANSEYDDDIGMLATHVLAMLVGYKRPRYVGVAKQDHDYLARTLQRVRDGMPVKEQM